MVLEHNNQMDSLSIKIGFIFPVEPETPFVSILDLKFTVINHCLIV